MSVPVNSCRGKNKQSGQTWYSRLSDEDKVDYLKRLRIARQQKKDATTSGVNMSEISDASLPSSPLTPFRNLTNTQKNGKLTSNTIAPSNCEICTNSGTCLSHFTTLLGAGDIGPSYFSMTRDFQTPYNESSMKHVSTASEFHGQCSFLEKSDGSVNKRQHGREMYSLMSDEQKEVYLHKKREYKKRRQETRPFVTPNTTPAMQATPADNYQTGILCLSVSSSHV